MTTPPLVIASHPTTAVLWCNLGTPAAPTAAAVRPYLAEFLSDRRVVEIPKLLWWPILHGIILRTRPRKSAAKYARIWSPEGSPLKIWTERQAEALKRILPTIGHEVNLRYAMRYGQPSIASQLDELQAQGMQRLLIVPAYPQYSGTTTASVLDAVHHWAAQQRAVPEMRFVNSYFDEPLYIKALAHKIQTYWQIHGQAEKLVMSFHGIPERAVRLGDPYQQQCLTTAALLARQLGLAPEQYEVTFQSRFGAAKWLTPYTEPTLRDLARQGVKRVDVVCPGFVSDCLETLEEIAQEARTAFLTAGGQDFHYIPCLNDTPEWIQALAQLSARHLQGWPGADLSSLQGSQPPTKGSGGTTG